MDQAVMARPLRADARRNRDQILAAACDVFVEMGPHAPLDEIARRAGTGIATLYRRFSDRKALMRAVIIDVMHRTAEEVRAARAEEPDPFRALVRYLHRALEIRAAAVIPALLDEFSLYDEEMQRLRTDASEQLEQLVADAQAAGLLRPDVTFGDIGVVVVRLSRPLPGPMPRDLDRSLSQRHLELFIDALRATPHRPSTVGGPALTLADLQRMRAGRG